MVFWKSLCEIIFILPSNLANPGAGCQPPSVRCKISSKYFRERIWFSTIWNLSDVLMHLSDVFLIILPSWLSAWGGGSRGKILHSPDWMMLIPAAAGLLSVVWPRKCSEHQLSNSLPTKASPQLTTGSCDSKILPVKLADRFFTLRQLIVNSWEALKHHVKGHSALLQTPPAPAPCSAAAPGFEE